MNKFENYRYFPDIESAVEFTKQLNSENIEFEIDDSALRFSLVSENNINSGQVVVKIKKEDIEIAYKLFKPESEKLDFDHYLYTFSDQDIINAISNPEEWTSEELEIAKQIVKDRNISLQLKPEYQKNQVEKNHKTEHTPWKVYNWFLTIALLSIISTISITSHWNYPIKFGLGLTMVLDGIFHGYFGGFKPVGIIVSILFSSTFIMFWYYAKRKKVWAYVWGISIYGIDTILAFYIRDWAGIVIHLIAITSLIIGYRVLKNNVA